MIHNGVLHFPPQMQRLTKLLRSTSGRLLHSTTFRALSDRPGPPDARHRTPLDYEEIEEYFEEGHGAPKREEDAGERFRRSVPIPLKREAVKFPAAIRLSFCRPPLSCPPGL